MAGLAIGNAYPGRLQQPFYPQQSRKPTTRTAHGHDRPPPDRARTTTATAHLRWIWLGHTQRGRDAGARPASAEPAAGTRGPVGSREMYSAAARCARTRGDSPGPVSAGWPGGSERLAVAVRKCWSFLYVCARLPSHLQPTGVSMAPPRPGERPRPRTCLTAVGRAGRGRRRQQWAPVGVMVVG
jgi:hypothetical protein